MATREGNESRIDEALAILAPMPTSAEQDRRAAITACAHAVDLDDARELLAALGLHGGELHDPQARSWRIVHGTRNAAEAHQDAGTPLCEPCLRWQDVEDRKSARAAS